MTMCTYEFKAVSREAQMSAGAEIGSEFEYAENFERRIAS